MTRTYSSLRICISAFATFIACLLLLGSGSVQDATAQQASAIPNPQGWHLLYNVARKQCLDLHKSPIFQHCSQGDQQQQYAIVNDNAIFVNRSSALCLGYLPLANESGAHPLFVGEGNCSNQSVPAALRYRYGRSFTWTVQDAGVGAGGIEQYQIVDGSSCLQPYSYQGAIDLVEQPCNASNSNQLWQFR